MKRLALAAALAAAAIAVPLSIGSSHREAPNIMLDPTADNTDVYAYTANDKPGHLTVIANWIPGEVPANGPNFFRWDDRARYYINIDNDGDGKPDVRYRYEFSTTLNNPNSFLYALPQVTSFDDPQLNVRQTYNVWREEFEDGHFVRARRVGTHLSVPPSNVGPKTMPDYQTLFNEGVHGLNGGGKTWAGQADDPFFVDLGTIFDAINIRKGTGNEGEGKDDLSGFSIHAIVLQVPESDVTNDGHQCESTDSSNAVVGVWSTTERRRLEVTNADFDKRNGANGPVQVSRLGNPLVNEVVIPLGKKDQFNRTTPDQDAALYGSFVVQPELAGIMNALFGVGAPTTGRTDIVQALLQGLPGLNQLDPGPNPLPTDTLKLNLCVPPSQHPNRFGVLAGDNAGFPNGRRLFDDVVDIELQVVAGILVGNPVPLGDGVDKNDKTFPSAFPYLALPDSGFDSKPSTRIEPTHPPTPPGGG